MAVDTLYRPQAGGGGGSGSSDYIKDLFQDVSRKATNNTNLTSSATTNPLSEFFNNTDSPQYGTKALFIKGLELIADKSKWISNKPTYKVIFTENFPQVKAYAYGNVRMLDTQTGFSLFMENIDDAIGVVGQVRQVGWILNTQAETATVTPYLDNVAGSALTHGSAAVEAVQKGVNNFNILLQSASQASNDIHDHRIEADVYGVTRVVGMVVCFENTGANIEVRPGSSYVDKTLATTTVGATMALPTIAGRLGGKSLVYKTAALTYLMNTLEPSALETTGVGLSGTNLVDTTTGQGGSFPIGTLFGAIASGTSFYFGRVSNQSTDTLTVGPTLPFALSGPLYKYGYAGTTFAIAASYYKASVEIDPERITNPVVGTGFGATTGALYYQDPESRFRIWGSNLYVTTLEGVPGIGFLGASGWLQIEGKFAAMDFEHKSAGILHATFSINGLNCFGLNAGFSGLFKKSILTDSGPGFNRVVIAPGASFDPANNVFSKFTLYDLHNQGITAGLLAEFPTYVNTIPHAAENATFGTLGAVEKHYADELYLSGMWTRVNGASFAGGVAYYGASTNSTLKFQYYGTNFAFQGTVGGSMTALLDGASIGVAFNVMKSVATLGWHTVSLAYNAGATAQIEAIAVLKPQTGELTSLQKFDAADPRLDKIPDVWRQSQTPQQAKDGDMWVQSGPTARQGPLVWIKAFGFWLQLPITNYTVDPNTDDLFVTGGITDTGTAYTAATTRFNNISWSTSVSCITARSSSGRSGSQFGIKFLIPSGNPGPLSSVEGFNKTSWVLEGALPAVRVFASSYQAFGFIYCNKGTPDGTSANAVTTGYKYNGASWATPTAWAGARYNSYEFVTASLLDCMGGGDTAGSATNLHETRSAADSVSSTTVTPTTIQDSSSANVNSSVGMFSTGTGGAPPTATAYTWNGAAWSSALTAPVSQGSSTGANSPSRNLFYGSGGSDGSSNPNANSYSYNNTSFITNANLPTARRLAFSGCI
jgi:hypothetical protein